MLFSKKSFLIAALSTLATVGYAGSAHAINFKVTTGTTGLNGETNQGAFSEFSSLANTVTVDFNSGQIPTDGFAKYSFVGNSGSSVRADMWAPVGSNGDKNNSNYLAVFDGKDVVIQLDDYLNYFGINWGAAHTGNIYSFYNGDSLVSSFSTADIDAGGGFALYSALHPGGNEDGAKLVNGSYYQGNGYVHFYSTNSNDIFNKIVISQEGGGGFETDNHSFHKGTTAFTGFDSKSVPEPSAALGMLAIGGVFLRKRKHHKTVQLG
ncbi:PEP-CTERM sorting domain-containing protein [Mastigocladus laminosus UU774]|nr:PEP-CTERM sorting domain-containing protein [Westiellopsis prolifica IICB1]TFI51261.1 PEP-CTERM sorting domain-containing protein [Mastigocladus laminosus UU774]